MSALDAIARLVLPAELAHALSLAEQLPQAVSAARAALDAGRGPLVALREFAARTDGRLDDQAARQLEVWLTSAIGALDAACAAGVWLSAHEPQIRGGVETALATAFGAAYQAAAARDVLRRWRAA